MGAAPEGRGAGRTRTPAVGTPKRGPAGRTGRGPEWGAGLGAQGGDEGRLGEGRAALGRRGSGCGERRTGVGVVRGGRDAALTHLRVEGGGARVGVHVQGGGRRLRECRGPGCGRRDTEPLRAGGSGGRTERGRTREGSPRLEMMRGLGALRPRLSAPGPAAPRPSRVGDAAPAAGAVREAGESLRGAAAAASGNPTRSPT